MIIPPFDLQGGIILVAARDASVTALLSAYGTIVFRAVVAPKTFPRMPPELIARLKRQLFGLAQFSILAAILGTAFWLIIQSASLADADALTDAIAAVPTVLRKTSCGHVMILQFAALIILALTLGRRDHDSRQPIALTLATLTVALQSGHSHAYSMCARPSLLLASDILHLLGAGAWLGGLLPLLLTIRLAPPKAGATATRWFSPLGQWYLVAITISAAYQGWELVGNIPGLIGTAYGWLALIKFALFGALFGFAWINRYHFAPALLRENPDHAKRILIRSISLQTLFALAILISAVVLSNLPPSVHQQTLWPFAQRFSLTAIEEDASFRREVIEAGLAIAGAALLVITAFLLRRLRLAAIALAAIIAWFALPHFDLLLVPAYPTSFYHSPSGFTSATITEGQALFSQNCVSCHGANGMGDGTAAKSLLIPPADLTAAHLWQHSDGELFWWISHGMTGPEGSQTMPGFADTIDEDSRWALIDYIRAHNAGTARQPSGDFPRPVQAPGFGLRCGAAKPQQLSDLRGHYVRLVIGAPPPLSNFSDITTIFTVLAPDPALCIASDETLPLAYAITSGITPSAITGTQFLIDPSGWLRALQFPATGDWNDPAKLKREIQQLQAHPVTLPTATPMKMPM